MAISLWARSEVSESKRTPEGQRVADALRELRMAAKQTQEDTARMVNLTLAGYRPYEQGKRTLKLDQVNMFAAAFGVSPESLAARVGLRHTDSRTMSFSADFEIFQHQLAALPPELATSLLDMWRASLAIAAEARKLREN